MQAGRKGSGGSWRRVGLLTAVAMALLVSGCSAYDEHLREVDEAHQHGYLSDEDFIRLRNERWIGP